MARGTPLDGSDIEQATIDGSVQRLRPKLISFALAVCR